MLTINHLSIQRSGQYLLENVDLTINPGSRIAIVGANGCGKSTLFSLIMGQLTADSGNVRMPGGTRIAHMAQETPALDCSALDFVLDGDKELRRIQAALQQAEADGDGMAVAHYHQALDAIDGYTAEVRARQLLEGLGFRRTQQEQPVASFSGGWRIRLNLAQALMCPSDLMLLDEPTNHLDLDALVWLENWLLRYSGTLLFISHDRDFIDHLATHIVHFEHRCLQLYTGNYSQFEVARASRLAQQQAMHEKQQTRIAEIQNYVRKFGAKATKARQAQSRLKELARMELIAPAHVDSPFKFSLPCSDKMSSPLLVLDNATLGYGQKPVVDKVNLTLLPGMRIGVLGANGEGKSTLVKTLAGELNLLSGDRTGGEHLKIGYFAQHQLEALDVTATPLQMLQKQRPSASEQEIRNFLGGFGFPGDQATGDVRNFSGGERARLALALIAWNRPNLLLLDEPTNHLDLEMRHALNIALQEYPGTVIVVSHDRHLLRALADQFVWVHAGKVEPYDGSLEDYEAELTRLLKLKAIAEKESERLAGQNGDDINGEAEAGKDVESAEDKKARKREEAERRQKLSPLKKQIGQLEQKMESLHETLAKVEDRLSDNDLYQDQNKDQLKQALADQQTVKQELSDVEEQWLALNEELESLSS
ncbi:ABC transporter ATP-binding protein [Hahella sp. CCB-MM4]|uniref:ATP-binding cassette domain-containing protein n=1 Tax=Hahella sp. (strain CCB-MM4) TaxID=1926491 RepID=UPI000B9B7746|nr:ATP-binding cassette domain-containing protein [Hahella sp. CCB-MM4]OZG74811.1 ABC transporter ATP-binding protein [Hahella sp. CCB-MM4]